MGQQIPAAAKVPKVLHLKWILDYFFGFEIPPPPVLKSVCAADTAAYVVLHRDRQKKAQKEGGTPLWYNPEASDERGGIRRCLVSISSFAGQRKGQNEWRGIPTPLCFKGGTPNPPPPRDPEPVCLVPVTPRLCIPVGPIAPRPPPPSGSPRAPEPPRPLSSLSLTPLTFLPRAPPPPCPLLVPL